MLVAVPGHVPVTELALRRRTLVKPDSRELSRPKKMNSWGMAALSSSAISLILHVGSFIVPAAVGQALCLGRGHLHMGSGIRLP